MKRVTDLEKFALEEVWRPYQNMMGYEKRLERLPVGLEETARLLQADTTGWSKRVIDRIKNIGVTFPDYIQHPLVDLFGGGTKSDGGSESSRAVCPLTDPAKQTGGTDASRLQASAGVASGPSDPAQEPDAVAYRWRYVDEKTWTLRKDRPRHADDHDVFCEPLYTRPVSLDRDAVARIIDPEAFEAWDRAEGNWRKDEAKVHCWPAEEKTDAILALIEGRA